MAQQAQVTEEQARALAEESRESGWDKPSFAKGLFLGRFPLELVHPFPKPSDADEARTRAFLDKLREFLDTIDGSVIERDAQIPDEYVKGLADPGLFRHEDTVRIRRPGHVAGCLQPGPGDGSPRFIPASARCCRPISRSGFPSRSNLSAVPNRSGSSCRAAPLGQYRRSCSPNPTSAPTRRDWRRRRHRSKTARRTNSRA